MEIYQIILIVLAVLSYIICIYLSSAINEEKGFDGFEGAILGFLLGWLGLIIVVLRPYKPQEVVKIKNIDAEVLKKLKNLDTDVRDFDDNYEQAFKYLVNEIEKIIK